MYRCKKCNRDHAEKPVACSNHCGSTEFQEIHESEAAELPAVGFYGRHLQGKAKAAAEAAAEQPAS